MFNNQVNGKNEYYWFLGQVVDDVNWQGNINPKIHTRDDVPGWGYRYKVRIFGRDTRTKETTDNQLEMAEVMLPVTAGSGHAGSVQTPNIRQGAFVTGFYKDGQDATEPVITGILFNNSQTKLFGGDPDFGWTPRSGYFGLDGNKPLATKNIETEFDTEYKFPPTLETAQQIAAIYHYDQLKDGARCNYIPKTRQCDGPSGELKGIQRQIKNTLNLINEIKTNANSFIGAASDLNNQVNSLLNDATTFITGLVKTLIDKMRSYVVNKLNNGIKDVINLTPPNLQAAINGATETATDTLQCAFNKIIGKLFNLVQDLLGGIIDKYINAPMCAVEQFVGDLLGQVLGDITAAIDGALAAINGLLGQAASFIGSVLDALDIVSGILKFLSCEEELDCSMTEEWSFWYGPKCFTEEVSSNLKSKIQNIAIPNQQDSGGGGGGSCNTGTIPCGPPKVVVDGTGTGAAGNPIISATGSVLGIDFVSGGTGYSGTPNVQIVDDCGKGNGAVIYPRTTQYFVDIGVATTIPTIVSRQGIVTTFSGISTTDFTRDRIYIAGIGTTTANSIVDAVVLDPGVGYIPAPDGSTGGNDNTVTKPNDTLYVDNKGNYTVIPPNTPVNVVPGDTIYLPPATTVPVYNNDGNLVVTLPGQGQTVPIAITTSGTLTTPVYNPTVNPGQSPTTNGTYPVVLTIKDVVVTNPGVGYTNTDTISIVPDNGAVLNPIFNNGQLINVEVIRSGIGFTDFPKITIISNSGFNAQVTPVFGIIRINEEDVTIPPGTPVIDVIDCVGRVF